MDKIVDHIKLEAVLDIWLLTQLNRMSFLDKRLLFTITNNQRSLNVPEIEYEHTIQVKTA